MAIQANQLSIMVVDTNWNERDGEEKDSKPKQPPFFLVQEGDLWRSLLPPEFIEEPGIQQHYGGKRHSPCQETIEADVDKTLKELLVTETFKEDTIDKLKFLGSRLFKTLLPKKLRDGIKGIANAQGETSLEKLPTLRIYSHQALGWIPWELMHDGRNFLGLRYQIARLPILMAVESENKRPREDRLISVGSVTSILAEGLLEDPDKQIWQDTFSFLAGKVSEVRYPDENNQHKYPLLKQVAAELNKAELFHITCHGDMEGGILTWKLMDKPPPNSAPFCRVAAVDLTRPDELMGNGLQPFVFGNACGGGGQGQGILTECFSRQLSDVYSAAAYVGAFAKVTKHLAVGFAHHFYRNLFNESTPMTVGEALWKTKYDFAQQEEKDPSWLFYYLWGLPDTRFCVKAH